MNTRTVLPEQGHTPPISCIEISLLEQLFDEDCEIVFFIKDVQGRYLAANRSLLTRHGLQSKSQVIGKTPSEICPGDFGRLPTEQDQAVLSSGRPLVDFLEMQWFTPHQPTWCLTTKLPLRNAIGEIIGLIGVSRDIRRPIDRTEIPAEFASALNHIEEQPGVDMTPARLAQRSRLSPQRLARLVKQLFNLTPTQLIAKIRISAASRMLLNTEQSISEIAQACGFYDHSAFSRAFRSATGMTPREFRKQLLSIREL